MSQPRPHQAEVLAYRGGRMGVAAVPGSGKTWTLAQLAARLVQHGGLADDQEVLIVTLVNSAVDNFYRRLRAELRQTNRLTFLGYRVRTLHGLSHDIVRERPALTGLAENFQIVDEREAEALRAEAAQTWLRAHPGALDEYLSETLSAGGRESVRHKELPALVGSLALTFIRFAKDREWTPEELRDRLAAAPLPLPLAALGADLYADYQRALAYRGAVDFDDLIRLALRALRDDAGYLARLRRRWPYILEDEAQDSSRLQQEILNQLAGPTLPGQGGGNWVRVGDPNQAIYETFTTASPEYLLRFLDEPGVTRLTLPESGRSQPSLMRLANTLVAWTRTQHPVASLRDALAPAVIQPTPPGDPQPNPPDNPAGLRFVAQKQTPAREIERVAESLARWLPEHADRTVAVLVPTNQRGFDVVDALRRRSLPVEDSLLRSTQRTRRAADTLAAVIESLVDPLSGIKLAGAFAAWQHRAQDDEAAWARVEAALAWLKQCRQVEDYLWPAGADWLAETGLAADEPDLHAQLADFQAVAQRWQGALTLPVDQLLLSLAQELFSDPVDLALTHKLAATVGRTADAHPEWRLPALALELAQIARNERRFLGFDETETGFEPDQHPGKVVVATLHKAKGLEWDRVYLLSATAFDFPAGLDGDEYMAERWYLRGRLNLEAEALGQLRAAAEGRPYEAGGPTQQARLDYARERLRLLYVGVTRARRELMVSWNTGRREDHEGGPAVAFLALQEDWDQQRHGPSA